MSKVDLHVEWFHLSGNDEHDSVLSKDEVARSKSITHPGRRRAFIICRTRLRIFLGRLLSEDPSRLVFERGEHGKPILKFPAMPVGFNLSHSGNMGGFAVGTFTEVGFDVEAISDRRPWKKIAERFFEASEVVALRSLPKALQKEAFYQLWACKEAVQKGTGKGFSLPLRSFALKWDQKVQEIHLTGLGMWSVHQLDAPMGFVSSVAVNTSSIDRISLKADST